MKKVIERQIESAGTRRALLEKGDADLSFNLPPKDFAELAKEGKLKVIGTQIDAELLYMDMNVTMPPFDNPKVRQAIAYAVPYQDILHTGLYDRGIGMFGAQGRRHDDRLAPAFALRHRSRQGEGAAQGGRLSRRLQDDAQL